MSINEIKADDFGLIKRSGLIKNPNWDLKAGKIYYLGLDGNITDKEPKKKLLISIGVAFSFDALSIRILPV